MLDKNDIAMYHETASEHSKYAGLIEGRINHILNEVLPKAVESFRLDWWDWPNGDKYRDGCMDYGFEGESINIDAEWTSLDDPDAQNVISDIIYNCLYEMLFISDDQIVDEVNYSIQSIKEKKVKAKIKREENKKKKEKIKKAALKKLSPEERKALGVK